MERWEILAIRLCKMVYHTDDIGQISEEQWAELVAHAEDILADLDAA